MGVPELHELVLTFRSTFSQYLQTHLRLKVHEVSPHQMGYTHFLHARGLILTPMQLPTMLLQCQASSRVVVVVSLLIRMLQLPRMVTPTVCRRQFWA